VKSSNPALVPTNSIVVSGTGANRSINITPVPSMAGAALITLIVSGGRDAAIETFAVTVGSFSWIGGSGNWDTTSSNWNNGTAVWPSIGGNNDAFFGGTPGVVSVEGTIRADDLTFNSSGFVITNGTLQFDVTPALTVSNGMTATIASALSGTPGMAKEGAGTLILAGNNPYAGGIYVNSGALFIHGTTTEASTIEARNGTLLGGTGSLAPVTVRSGAELSPGPQPNATLTTEGLTFESGSTLTVDLDVIGDRIAVNGNVTLNGVLNVRLSGSVLNGAYTIISYTGMRSGSGLALTNIPSGYSMALDYGTPGEVRLLVSGGLDRAPVVPAGSVWKFNASGANLGAAWRSNNYDDATWSSGPAQIGYGDGDETTLINGATPQIVYLRKTFTLTAEEIGAMSNSILSLLRDDGAVVYLNGVEVRRDNLPAAPAVIVYNTPALNAVTGADEDTFFSSPLNPALFIAGTNLLAVEVHQDDPSSSDISFDLKLERVVQGSGSPAQFIPVSLIATGAVWKYFDNTNDLGAAWRSNSFNDAGWAGGRSMLGFGDANGLLPSTTVASNGQITTYFRHTILVPNAAQVQALSARILRDDAAVIYLNGAEVWRDPNLPGTGQINYRTPATAALGGVDESTWLNFAPDPSAPLSGTNLIAIEVHQNSATSSDVAMNFELAGTLLLPLTTRLAISGSALSWPAEAGWFSLESTTNLTPPVVWSPLLSSAQPSNGLWHFPLPATTNAQTFYRLRGPVH
jgi:autotransporter-associated beta strand protein